MNKQTLKLTILVLTVAIVLLVPTGILVAKPSLPEREVTIYYENIRINEGDSLWSIAKKYKPKNESVKKYIRLIMEINGLNSDLIHADSYIIIPLQYEIQPGTYDSQQ